MVVRGGGGGLGNQSIDQSINQKKPDSQSLERTSAIQVIFKQIEIKTYKLSTSSPFRISSLSGDLLAIITIKPKK